MEARSLLRTLVLHCRGGWRRRSFLSLLMRIWRFWTLRLGLWCLFMGTCCIKVRRILVTGAGLLILFMLLRVGRGGNMMSGIGCSLLLGVFRNWRVVFRFR